MSTKKDKLLLIILSAMMLVSACGDEGSITVTYNSSAPAVSATPEQTATPSPTVSPTPSPTPVPTVDPLDDLISKMSDKELVGQVVMIGFEGTGDMDSESRKLMQEYSVGSVLLFGWNTDTFSQTKSLIKKVNSHNKSDIPLLMGIDLEGGSVTRFVGQWKPSLNSAQKLGQTGDPNRVYEQYKRIGEKLVDTGFNINFAPVLDIARNPSSTFLGNRMFGTKPEKVVPLVTEAVRGLHDAGIAALGKHFPGHGDTASDSHKTLPVIKATLEDMQSYSLVPFQAAIDEGVDAMLVAHLSYPRVDSEYITSISPTIITKILREQMGFEGVVFSDDLRMQGLRKHYSAGEGAVLHILAGGDVVLIGGKKSYNNLKKQVLSSLYKAVQQGKIPRERLEQSVRRILKMKQKYCGLVL